ncbi:PadR family transcriptional regulator [Oceanobacillus manasiensis]|uniref:PadR family transcriptional regulator n=1 Tax=Oceanobacillus manasiensis TaxID=586413 RepID=UPI0005AB3190|nr:PadR family transcriptional regulator [Oceanobacillus manasiensis]
MKKYNNTTYAILGILTTGCTSGYEIKQLMDKSLNHFWKISYGQIYPTLKQLAEDELVTVTTTSQDGKPDRKEYELTSKGIDALEKWLTQPIEQVPVERNEVLLKLFFGRHQPTEKTLAQLEDYKLKLEGRFQTYTTIEQAIRTNHANDPDARYWLFTLDYGKRTTAAAIDWCDATLNDPHLTNV